MKKTTRFCGQIQDEWGQIFILDFTKKPESSIKSWAIPLK
jgi:hypothetical protein